MLCLKFHHCGHPIDRVIEQPDKLIMASDAYFDRAKNVPLRPKMFPGLQRIKHLQLKLLLNLVLFNFLDIVKSSLLPG